MVFNYFCFEYLVVSRHVLKGHTIDQAMINFPDKKKLPGHEKCLYDSLLWSVDFSHDGSLLASTGTDSHVFVWDVMTGRQKCDFIIPNDGSAVCFVETQQGTYLAAASAPHMTITLLSVGDTSQVISVLGGHSHWVRVILRSIVASDAYTHMQNKLRQLTMLPPLSCPLC